MNDLIYKILFYALCAACAAFDIWYFDMPHWTFPIMSILHIIWLRNKKPSGVGA